MPRTRTHVDFDNFQECQLITVDHDFIFNLFHSVDHTVVIDLFLVIFIVSICVMWPTVSKSVISRLWNKPKMLTTDPVQVVPEQSQEYRIDSSVTSLYEIDLKRQIKLLQTFIRLHVSSSGQTMRNRRHAAHLHARRPRVAPTLTNRHIAHGRGRCRESQKWGISRWSRVMLSDESVFNLDFLDKRDRVWPTTK